LKRSLIVALGVALAALALHALVSRSPGRAPAAPADHIDPASKAKLERVLRDAEREARPR